jgi:hypothetical protein
LYQQQKWLLGWAEGRGNFGQKHSARSKGGKEKDVVVEEARKTAELESSKITYLR